MRQSWTRTGARPVASQSTDFSRISGNTLASFDLSPPSELSACGPPPAVGDIVWVGRKRLPAICRFAGETSFAGGLWYGVELTTRLGKNDGSLQGVRYFTCEKQGNYGIFVRRSALEVTVESKAIGTDGASGRVPAGQVATASLCPTSAQHASGRANLTSRELARRNLAVAVEDCDLRAIRQLFPQAHQLGVDHNELEAALRTLSARTELTLLGELQTLREDVQQLSVTVQAAELRALRAEQRAAEAERANMAMKQATDEIVLEGSRADEIVAELGERIARLIEGRATHAIQDAVALATEQLSRAAAEVRALLCDMPTEERVSRHQLDSHQKAGTATSCTWAEPSRKRSPPSSPRSEDLSGKCERAFVKAQTSGRLSDACVEALGSQRVRPTSTPLFSAPPRSRRPLNDIRRCIRDVLVDATLSGELRKAFDAVTGEANRHRGLRRELRMKVNEAYHADILEAACRDLKPEDPPIADEDFRRQLCNAIGDACRSGGLEAALSEMRLKKASDGGQGRDLVHEDTEDEVERLVWYTMGKTVDGASKRTSQTTSSSRTKDLSWTPATAAMVFIPQIFHILSANKELFSESEFRHFAEHCDLKRVSPSWDEEVQALFRDRGWQGGGVTLPQFVVYMVETQTCSQEALLDILGRAQRLRESQVGMGALGKNRDGAITKAEMLDGLMNELVVRHMPEAAL